MLDNCPTIFPDQPDSRPYGEGYILKSAYFFETPEHYIHVPAGLLYDGASVPRIVWTISGLSPDGLHRAAALIHDWLYINKGIMPRRVYSRKECDKLFKEIMINSGCSKYRANLAYLAVRSGGWTFWN